MYRFLYQQVKAWIPEKSRVLDLGTGDGEFLEELIKTKRAQGEGVEQDPARVTRCIGRGLVVHQGDILNGLDHYGVGAFDYVLMLGTFQELKDPEIVLRESFRVGKRVIISYSNFAHWRARLQMMFEGRTPMTKALPSPWYRTPNLHFFSVLDFQDFCREAKVKEVQSAFFNGQGAVRLWPNLRSELALSLLEPNGIQTAEDPAPVSA
jgi:methionine biosynthesis protein MetW